MRISDWSSDVCSSDLTRLRTATVTRCCSSLLASEGVKRKPLALRPLRASAAASLGSAEAGVNDPMPSSMPIVSGRDGARRSGAPSAGRSEEHTSELQSLMRISYAVFCLKKKNKRNRKQQLGIHALI